MISRDTYIELTKFGIVGGLSFGLDLGIYYGLTEFLGFPTWLAKSISVASATYFNYYLNKSWTWGKPEKNKRLFVQYIGLYAISGIINVITNELLLRTLPDNEFVMMIQKHTGQEIKFFAVKLDKFLAVIGATIVGMIINFTGQKLWLFKTKKEDVSEEVLDY